MDVKGLVSCRRGVKTVTIDLINGELMEEFNSADFNHFYENRDQSGKPHANPSLSYDRLEPWYGPYFIASQTVVYKVKKVESLKKYQDWIAINKFNSQLKR